MDKTAPSPTGFSPKVRRVFYVCFKARVSAETETAGSRRSLRNPAAILFPDRL